MPNAKKPVTPENMQTLAIQIIDWLAKQGLFECVCILVNGQMLKSENSKDLYLEEKTTQKGVKYYVVPDIDIANHLEYSNPDTINLTFEGPLYDMINHIDYDFVYKMTKTFLDPYGLYFEQGYAWSLSAFS